MSELQQQQVALAAATAHAVSKSKQIDHYTGDVVTQWGSPAPLCDATGIRSRTAGRGEWGE